MEQTNHHDSEQDPFWESDWPPNLAHAGVPSVPDVLLPTVLARLGLNHAPFSAEPSIEELVTALDDPAWHVRTAAIRAHLYPGQLHWRSHRLIPRLFPYWLRRLPFNNRLHPLHLLHLLHPAVPVYFTSLELDWQHCSW